MNRALQSASNQKMPNAMRTHLLCRAATLVIGKASKEPDYASAVLLFSRAGRILEHVPTLDTSEEYINTGCLLDRDRGNLFFKMHDWKHAEEKYLLLESVCNRYAEDHICRASALARLHQIGVKINRPYPEALETAEIILQEADPSRPGPEFYVDALEAVIDSQLLSEQVDKAERTLQASEQKLKATKWDQSRRLESMHAAIKAKRGRGNKTPPRSSENNGQISAPDFTRRS